MIDFGKLPLAQEDLDELSKLNIDFAFQPIFDSRNLKITGYEALMRPKDKTPLQLIDEYRKENKLHVIELATCFGAVMAYEKRGYSQDLCINSFPCEALSEEQSRIYFECFPDMRGKIIVEMVEYTGLDEEKWKVKKRDIDANSMRVSLDDFSKGNNDLDAMEFFNPEIVKLDRSLINDINNDKTKQERVVALVEYFHNKGIKVVAEGIETGEELVFIRFKTDVDYLQGYYMEKPK